ncbi:MAG: hypothetical protein HY537_00235 [Deltaproteobacteria bacterium]|nr:hypothetical protein [Deltaproteobacteria bacterium]
MKALLYEIFCKLDAYIEAENNERRKTGSLQIAKSEAIVLGQMSLLANEKVAAVLALSQTADLDALLTMDSFAIGCLRKILQERGLIYDEDSNKIWIPEGATFEPLFDLKNIKVKTIDAESALVSKAIKAPKKNKTLIRQAIALKQFPKLVDRIVKNGGDLKFFAKT